MKSNMERFLRRFVAYCVLLAITFTVFVGTRHIFSDREIIERRFKEIKVETTGIKETRSVQRVFDVRKVCEKICDR